MRGLLPAPLLLVLLLTGCGRSFLNLGDEFEALPADSVAIDLYLIGDAGLPAPGGEPVLKALREAISEDPDRSLVVFLGDNVYPHGLPDSAAPDRDEAERILNAQIDAVKEAGGRGIFVPGNHDWDAGSPRGWRAIVRQQRYIDERGEGLVRMLPSYGCPGPEVEDLGRAMRLVFLDTQWWLQRGPKPVGEDSACRGASTEGGVVDSLRTVIAGAEGRAVVVFGHHPVASGGPHGGYFDWPTYIFAPYPWARRLGFSDQDFGNPEYQELIAALTRAFRPQRPLIYAAGHEHNLQVFRRDPAYYLLVSGAGIYGHTEKVRAITGTRYANRASGFMRMSVLRSGQIRLAVIVVGADGEAREDFAVWLTRRPGQTPSVVAP